jgi:hypothetical protein
MAYLIDTTILGRLANVRDMHHAVAAQAVLELPRRGMKSRKTKWSGVVSALFLSGIDS